MAVYSIFEHPAGDVERTIFVKEGFSGAAFLFSVLWALWYRMWIVAAALLAVFAVMAALSTGLGIQEQVIGVLHLGIGLLFGLTAQDLRAASLRQAGYRETGLIVASNLEEAELKHLLSTQPSPAPQERYRILQAPTDTLGLFGNV
jgi:hypothetical protein